MTRGAIAGPLSGLRQTLYRYRGSIAFRLTLSYGLLATFTTVILLAFIYTRVMGVLHTQLSEQIGQAEQRLAVAFASGNIEAVKDAVNLAIADELDGGDDLFQLTDKTGRMLAGTARLTESYPEHLRMFESDVIVDGNTMRGYFKIKRFPDGNLLLIGRGAEKIDRVTSTILRGVITTVGFAVLLIGLGTYMFRRELERRVRGLRMTARRIGPGQLSLRVPQAPALDEFSHLSQDVNAMLDRIEKLMTGVRHVSDTIAHELRTPLMRIQGRIRSVDSQASRADLQRVVDRIGLETDRLHALLSKLLQLSELEAGVRRKTFAPCRLDLIALDLLDLYDALAEEENISLMLHAPEACTVHGDAELLGSVYANLLDNALRYACAAVRVSVLRDSLGVTLAVDDDGGGVSVDGLARLGERFHRPNTHKAGLGLGLANVKAVVALHGGTLTIVNVTDEQGKRGLGVRVHFPANIEPSPDSQAM